MANKVRLQTVTSLIKSCIASRQDGVPLHEIEEEYKSLVGESIPYQILGHKTLRAFLLSIKDVRLTRKYDKEILTVSDEKINHIVDMVSKQKRPAKRGYDKKKYNRYKPYNIPNYRPDNESKKYTTKEHYRSSTNDGRTNRPYNRPNTEFVPYNGRNDTAYYPMQPKQWNTRINQNPVKERIVWQTEYPNPLNQTGRQLPLNSNICPLCGQYRQKYWATEHLDFINFALPY